MFISTVFARVKSLCSSSLWALVLISSIYSNLRIILNEKRSRSAIFSVKGIKKWMIEHTTSEFQLRPCRKICSLYFHLWFSIITSSSWYNCITLAQVVLNRRRALENYEFEYWQKCINSWYFRYFQPIMTILFILENWWNFNCRTLLQLESYQLKLSWKKRNQLLWRNEKFKFGIR